MQDQTRQKTRPVLDALVDFAQKNYLMIGYIVASILLELTGVAVTSGKFYMTEPWLFLSFVAFLCLVSQFLPGHLPRYILFVAALAAHFVLDLIFIVIFQSTNTIFDFAMFSLRSDAMAIVESVPVSFTYVFVAALVISLYCTAGWMLKPKMKEPGVSKLPVIITSVVLAVIFAADTILIYFVNRKTNANDLTYRLYGIEAGTYSNRGMIGNFANDVARGLWFSDIELGDTDELNDFIYAKTTEATEFTGIAKGYNNVTILCESFEWFTFLSDAKRYPNGFAKQLGDGFTQDTLDAALRKLYPNLYRLYEDRSTVVLDNQHSLEKTDISENKSIIGNYPLYVYINYAYPTNNIPYSMPNVLKTLYGTESNSFHDGYKAFYNRSEHHTHALGFNSYTATEDMDIDDDDTGLGERNLDSLMMETCKEQMFPTGLSKPFNTFITTITQHGQYAYRENLKPYYAKMDELGILPLSDDEDRNSLRYYCAAGMDLDKAIGIMLDYLDETGLAQNTVVTLFGDHNCYYQGISNYVKNIYYTSASNYTELYRVPAMIRIGDRDMGNAHINKFTCVADIYPTLLDIAGVRLFSNLTYGESAFLNSGIGSVLYSRAYDRFITDKLYFNSINNLNYRAAGTTDAYINDVEKKALALLDKISHINRIFASDFFAMDGNEQKFNDALKNLNGIL